MATRHVIGQEFSPVLFHLPSWIIVQSEDCFPSAILNFWPIRDALPPPPHTPPWHRTLTFTLLTQFSSLLLANDIQCLMDGYDFNEQSVKLFILLLYECHKLIPPRGSYQYKWNYFKVRREVSCRILQFGSVWQTVVCDLVNDKVLKTWERQQWAPSKLFLPLLSFRFVSQSYDLSKNETVFRTNFAWSLLASNLGIKFQFSCLMK